MDGFVKVEFFPKRLIALAGSLLPGLACYACIAYTYVFQSERARNFTSTDCENVSNIFPPVSYSIGVWEPQKFFWLAVMFLHFPAKLFYPTFYRRILWVFAGENYTKTWFQIRLFILTQSMMIESIALVVVTVLDVRFVLHSIAFGVWQVAFMVNVCGSAILLNACELQRLPRSLRCTFWARVVLFLSGLTFAITSGITYFYYWTECLHSGYVIFSISEYLLVGCNTLFNLLAFWDFDLLNSEIITYRYDANNNDFKPVSNQTKDCPNNPLMQPKEHKSNNSTAQAKIV